MSITMFDIHENERKALAKITGNYDEAARIWNAIHRLVGFQVRKFEYENDGSHYNAKRAERLDREEVEKMSRVNGYLKKYGLVLDYAELYPDICKLKPYKPGCHETVIRLVF